jgi:hypothetical protein
MWEWAGQDFFIDGWMMHSVWFILTVGMLTLTRDGAERYIFDVFGFRLHYTLQLTMGKEMLWRFYCGMEPTSMKKL